MHVQLSGENYPRRDKGIHFRRKFSEYEKDPEVKVKRGRGRPRKDHGLLRMIRKPVLYDEIAPPKMRRRISSINQIEEEKRSLPHLSTSDVPDEPVSLFFEQQEIA